MFALKALACLLALPTLILAQSGCTGQITSSGGRKIAVVIDSSGSMSTTDPNNLRIVAGKAIVASLLTSDRVTTIDFDDSVRIISPLGPPSNASFEGIDADGGTYIAGGVKAAIDEITKNPGDATAGLSGVVVLTDGEDSFISDLVVQLDRAASLGIRVSFGFLSPFDVASVQDPSILSGILNTGGIYSTIDSDVAQANFVGLVLSHGLAAVDGGNSGSTLLLPGLVTAGNVSSSTPAKTFTYDSQAGEVLTITITAISEESFDAQLVDKTANKNITSASTGSLGVAFITYTVPSVATLEIDITTQNDTAGLFSIQLASSVNRTITVCHALPNTTIPSNNTIPTNTTNNNGSNTFTPTPTATFPIFTGAATVVRGVAIAALFPALLALGM